MSNSPTESVYLDEVELISLCCTSNKDNGVSRRISELICRSMDWDYLLSVAGRNAVLPLLANNLIAQHGDVLPVIVRKKLEAFLGHHTRNNLYLTSQLIRIVKLLSEKGIASLPLKGPVLAMQAYGNPVLRQFVDLDVLVKPRDFDTAFATLCENGFVGNGRASWLRRKAQYFTQRKDLVLTSPDRQVYLELHWKLSGSHFPMPVHPTEFWESLESLSVGGSQVLTMPFNDLFVYLCLHAARHEWERLSWITDLHRLIEAQEAEGNQIRWNDVLHHASRFGCERTVRLGLHLVSKFFGMKFMGVEVEGAEQYDHFEKIGERVRHTLFSPIPVQSSKNEKKQYLLSLQEKPTQRVRLYLVYLVSYFRILFIPNPLDKAIVKLPGALYPIYFVLRPFRLVMSFLQFPKGKFTDDSRPK